MASVLDKVKKDLGEAVRILKIDLDKNPQTASAYNVCGVSPLLCTNPVK